MNRLCKLTAIVMFFSFLIVTTLSAQQKGPRKSLKASVSQTIDTATVITITYSRPGVKGRVIWGNVVPYGLEKGNKYSKDKDFPWRGGANENTTIEFNTDLIIEGNKVSAGKYSMHFIPGEKEWKIMINTVNDKWGSYEYDSSKDAASFTVKPIENPFQEWLEYGFEDLDGYSATAYLAWEKLKVPFKIKVAE